MLFFLGAAIALIALTLWFILPVLLKPVSVIKNSPHHEKRVIFLQQFAELEQDQINGVLDATQYLAAKSELERRFFDEVGEEQVKSTTVKPDRRLAIILCVLLPSISAFLYLILGSPASIMLEEMNADNVLATSATSHQNGAGNIEPLLKTLKVKLESSPKDGAGWALLARSYVEIKQYSQAILAYQKAVKIISDDPQLLADYADTLAVVHDHKLAGKPEELVNLALKLDPHHVKALMLAATAAFDRKNYQQAISFWQRLQQDLPADSEMLPEVRAALEEANRLLGKNASTSTVKEDEVTKISGLRGTVRVSTALASQVEPASTVFIFARASQGPPMPLAILRTTASELPYTYHLDDSAALMPNIKLSQASEVVLVARISITGDAKAQSGDLQGVSDKVKPDGRIVDIEINQQIE